MSTCAVGFDFLEANHQPIAYIFDSDSEKEIATNVELLDRAIKTVDKLSPKLKFVVLPSGTKAYGVHLLDKFPFSNDLPLKETLPRIPEPFASQMFYYNQIDTLASMCKGKSWTWCEVIPDMVIGFVPNNNAYCLAQVLSTYLSLYAEINGKGSEVAFPGTEKSYTILSNDSSQDILAKASIYASLHPEVSAAQRYNVADNATPSTWEVKWPVICEYFGLKGVGPPPGGSGPQPSQYLLDHLTEWQALEKEYGLKGGRVGNDISVNGYAHFLMTLFDFDRHLDMTKLHGMMGDAKMETDAKGTWWTAFDRFRKANIIP